MGPLEFGNERHKQFVDAMNTEYEKYNKDKFLREAVTSLGISHPIRGLRKKYIDEKIIMSGFRFKNVDPLDMKLQQKRVQEAKDLVINIVMSPIKARLEKLYLSPNEQPDATRI